MTMVMMMVVMMMMVLLMVLDDEDDGAYGYDGDGDGYGRCDCDGDVDGDGDCDGDGDVNAFFIHAFRPEVSPKDDEFAHLKPRDRKLMQRMREARANGKVEAHGALGELFRADTKGTLDEAAFKECKTRSQQDAFKLKWLEKRYASFCERKKRR